MAVVKQRAVAAFDLCKRFYYYSLHLTLERLKTCGDAHVVTNQARLLHAGAGRGAGGREEAGVAPGTGVAGAEADGDDTGTMRLLDEACEYLYLTALLYDSSDALERR